MNKGITKEIQEAQDHGRAKYGSGPKDLAHDDARDDQSWYLMIVKHNHLAMISTPMERRQHLVKVAGLVVSAIESFDRKRKARKR